MKVSFMTVLAILILSLAIWSAFYALSEPLSPGETTVVVGICAGIVLFSKWAWSRVRKKEIGNEQ